MSLTQVVVTPLATGVLISAASPGSDVVVEQGTTNVGVSPASPSPGVVVETLQSPSTVLVTAPVFAVEVGSAQASASIVIRRVEAGPAGPPGSSSTTGSDTFETVSQNLDSLPKTLVYSGGVLTSVVYDTGAGIITKMFTYTSGDLTAVVLSGAVPAGAALTKTLTYTSGLLTGVSYS